MSRHAPWSPVSTPLVRVPARRRHGSTVRGSLRADQDPGHTRTSHLQLGRVVAVSAGQGLCEACTTSRRRTFWCRTRRRSRASSRDNKGAPARGFPRQAPFVADVGTVGRITRLLPISPTTVPPSDQLFRGISGPTSDSGTLRTALRLAPPPDDLVAVRITADSIIGGALELMTPAHSGRSRHLPTLQAPQRCRSGKRTGSAGRGGPPGSPGHPGLPLGQAGPPVGHQYARTGGEFGRDGASRCERRSDGCAASPSGFRTLPVRACAPPTRHPLLTSR